MVQNSYNRAEQAASAEFIYWTLQSVHYKPSWLLRAVLFLEDFPKAPAGLPLEILCVPDALVCLHLQCKQSELKCYFLRCQISSKPLKSMRKKQDNEPVSCLDQFWPAQSAFLFLGVPSASTLPFQHLLLFLFKLALCSSGSSPNFLALHTNTPASVSRWLFQTTVCILLVMNLRVLSFVLFIIKIVFVFSGTRAVSQTRMVFFNYFQWFY